MTVLQYSVRSVSFVIFSMAKTVLSGFQIFAYLSYLLCCAAFEALKACRQHSYHLFSA
jgi:hypothetical protein